MSEWISIEAAAEKYRLEKEYIWLWVEMKKSQCLMRTIQFP